LLLSELTDMTPCLPRPDELRCERWHLILTTSTLRIAILNGIRKSPSYDDFH